MREWVSLRSAFAACVRRRWLLGVSLLGALVLMGCGSPATITPEPTATTAPTVSAPPTTAPTETKLPPTPAPTQTPLPPIAAPTQVPPTETSFPLSTLGPYQTGVRGFKFKDASRGGREVNITVWYPGIRPPERTSNFPTRDAAPDASGAPYPLILSSTRVAEVFAPHLASHGFVVAGVDGIGPYAQANEEMIDQPLDILFMLEQLASAPPQVLQGMIDAERAGTLGYSFDGYNSLAMSGARINPGYYLAQCPTPDATTKAILSEHYSAFGCGPAQEWDKFTAHAPKSITTSADGLWQPMTDKRIRAVMPMASEGWWLFGEKGLASANRPTLMLAGTADELYAENALIFEHLGASDKALISFVGSDHMMPFSTEPLARMTHFVTAFFGEHLQNRDAYAKYMSKEFVEQFDDLAWGVYTK